MSTNRGKCNFNVIKREQVRRDKNRGAGYKVRGSKNPSYWERQVEAEIEKISALGTGYSALGKAG